ncbi:glutamate synthase large subunit [Ilumatobacter coccineus]|uniref:Glutamate synthase large subunit n=1 Tax=Ilumatobacter coccineus (strain NBRC 103263 / KCTC 29153 / YM16-304) TaxID=1313172 RepID=A0A6C7E8M5_ILUCY|nr:glutamate synthase large subunit [Ilumatobacter coccineus]BAN02760.1 glutamate synthase large subunit [Ilumatobacter coccineus YM16-304]
MQQPLQHAPSKTGLYDPRNEHDSCGVSFVANLKGVRSNELVQTGLKALTNLEHRGATGAEPDTGDGAGILLQVPDALFRAVTDFDLPAAGAYATGIAFLPADADACERAQAAIDATVAEVGLTVLGWRDLPTNPDCLGKTARAAMPTFKQLFVSDPAGATGLELDRKAFVARKRSRRELVGDLDTYFSSLSSRTIVYKGMLTTPQLSEFFPDLTDERIESALLLVHSRFSTNTFPSWPLAHPYRFVAHNGEINTVQGNQNWMRAREAMLESPHLPGIDRAFPICTPGSSDTARFDEVLELLHLGGYPIHHAVMMMIPSAWENDTTMSPELRDFFRFHATMMEPWDGPASVTFTDGDVIGATLDRNGLRPSRYWVTDDDLVVMASEVGVIDIDPSKVVAKGRLQPGKMFLIDTNEGRIVDDEEIKATLAAEHPYGKWLEDGLVSLENLTAREHVVFSHDSVLRRQQMFGYTHEELKILLAPMAIKGMEALGSMGTDTPLAVLSERPRLIFDYFKQLFAQVTNPPLDAIREEVVTAVSSTVGPEANLLDPGPDSCKQLALPYAIIDNDELAKIIHANDDGDHPGLEAKVLSGLYRVEDGGPGLSAALDRICQEASSAIENGARMLVLSDRNADSVDAPIPSLLLTATVHHHLVRTKQRTMTGLVVEAGDAREVHHMALLIGYGAGAINPYLAFESIEDLIAEGMHSMGGLDPQESIHRYIKACNKGVVKVMSKMGVSTVASYTGAQIFEAIGLSQELVDRHFTGTISQLGGIGIDEIAAEVAARHEMANPKRPEERAHRKLELGGEYQWRREGERHLFNPETVYKLQHSTRSGRYDIFKEYTASVDDQSKHLMTLRGLFEFATEGRQSIPIDEVEPVSEIVKRFSTGAMSYGSISAEAHETLAIAMNRLGAKSNTGEGGEDAERLYDPERRSSIKQVASGRFGVTSEYLTNSDDIQIKMAQGAKPGEGGQLPGHKVYPWIAKTRHSTPGVGLISPPPHHDIYSIEDLKQLIHDLKNANPSARVHVKLVAETGVGTVAAGVSKAKADVVLISGHDGGTGASPLTSLKHAGGPWELGLAETQQTLMLNGLRDRVVVQADGQMKTGRDVVIAALLGAEEFGFATAPLVVSGCIMMRVCHLDTCPVGIATQNPVLRDRYSGKADFVVNFMQFIAEEAREIMAELGFRTIEEMVGHVECLDTRSAVDHWKASGLDISPILKVPENPYGQTMHQSVAQDHELDVALDQQFIELAQPAINDGEHVSIELPIRNINRTTGTLLGHEVTKKWKGAGLPDGTIDITLTGSAGQSFGAFLPAGIQMRLIGDTNDYLGKGLSGGRLIVHPHPDATFTAEEQVIAGNVIGYGATTGEIYLRGIVGERFCVRNSGATVVSEGIGDHGCEYMTGGRVVVLGETGRNFGAGMSGGIAYVYDPLGTFGERVNYDMVQLEPLEDSDREFLQTTIERHRELTGSAIADRILTSWSVENSHFRKVMPTDYKRVLEVIDASKAAGLDEEATVEKIMEAARA